MFRGGVNGARWTRKIRVKEIVGGTWTGKYVSKTYSRTANEGQAAQVQRLDLAAQLCEASRKSATRKLTPKEIELKNEEKAMRAAGREATVLAMEKLKPEADR